MWFSQMMVFHGLHGWKSAINWPPEECSATWVISFGISALAPCRPLSCLMAEQLTLKNRQAARAHGDSSIQPRIEVADLYIYIQYVCNMIIRKYMYTWYTVIYCMMNPNWNAYGRACWGHFWDIANDGSSAFPPILDIFVLLIMVAASGLDIGSISLGELVSHTSGLLWSCLPRWSHPWLSTPWQFSRSTSCLSQKVPLLGFGGRSSWVGPSWMLILRTWTNGIPWVRCSCQPPTLFVFFPTGKLCVTWCYLDFLAFLPCFIPKGSASQEFQQRRCGPLWWRLHASCLLCARDRRCSSSMKIPPWRRGCEAKTWGNQIQ